MQTFALQTLLISIKLLKKKYKILLGLLIIFYPCYKGLRELIWVTHIYYAIDNVLQIKLRIDPDITGFQDFPISKTITITNSITNARLKTCYVSLEPTLYLFLDSSTSQKFILIADEFAGQNSYNYSTLQLIGKKDCLNESGGCGGFDNSTLAKLGKPYLIYDNKGFHK
jgi:hypothetical protein